MIRPVKRLAARERLCGIVEGAFMQKAIRFLIVLVVCTGIAAASWAEESGDCVRGTSNAPIKIEVFSDYQCPACRAFYLETMRTVLTEYAETGKACVVYREFPLNQHAHAREAARYGHAAMRVGVRPWALVTDALFNSQDQWAQTGDIEAVVSKALTGPDLAALRKQLEDPSLDGAVGADVALGQQRGVNSTPTFFITAKGKTEKVAAAIRYPILKRYLDSLLGQ